MKYLEQLDKSKIDLEIRKQLYEYEK